MDIRIVRIVQKMLDGRPYASSRAMSMRAAKAEIKTRASNLGGIARPSKCGKVFDVVVNGKVVETYHAVE